MKKNGTTRRKFMAQASAVTAAAMVSARAVVAENTRGANERINIGCIGVGNRGSGLMSEVNRFRQENNVQVAGVCDVWKVNLNKAADASEQQSGQRPETFTRFRDLLEMKDIDAVTIAPPDFAHTPILIEALMAGKDAYVEKPMAMDIENANIAVDLAREKQAVVQVGTQRRSDGGFKGAAQALATGKLKNITKVAAAYSCLGPRWLRSYDDCKREDVDWDAYLFCMAQRPFDPKLLRLWHLQKECTTGIAGLWMCHYADALNMLLGSTYPESAVCHGGTYLWTREREHADTFHALLSYPEKFLFSWNMNLGNAHDIYFRIMGTNGMFDMQTRQFSGAGADPKNALEQEQVKPIEGENHMNNWLGCLRSRKQPNGTIEMGHQHSVAAIMAAKALHTGQRHIYDPARREIRPG